MKTNLLALDVETGGLSPEKNSILSIGAVDIDSGEEFYIECRNYPSRDIDDFALKVNGFTQAQASDNSKVLPHVAYEALIFWVLKNNCAKMLCGENLPSFDVPFLKNAQSLGKQPWIFGHRYVDLHSVSYATWNRSVKMDETMRLLGLPEEIKPHNALNGARATRDALIGLTDKLGERFDMQTAFKNR